MASLIRHVVVSGPAVCLASPTQPSGSSPSDQQAAAAAKVRVGSSSRRLTNDFSNFSGASTSTATKKSQTGSMEENSDMELSARVSRRDSLFLSGALFLSLVRLSSNDAQAREGDKSKEAEQADQVKQDSGKVAERRKQNQQQQQDVSWGKIPQISRKSQEAEQASQVKEDSALVSERRKANSNQSGSPGDVIPAPQQQLLTEEKPVYFYEYPVAQQKSLEAEQADRVKQDSGKVAERRQKKKEQVKPVFFAL